MKTHIIMHKVKECRFGTPCFEVYMTEKEILISRASDKKTDADKNSMMTNTNFLSVDERSELSVLERKLSDCVDTFYFGGYPDAERTVAIFIPKFFALNSEIDGYFAKCPDDNPISVIRLTKDRFSTLSHRDYLGALMGLGIKREMLGDIITDSDGAYIFSLKSVASFICENLTQCGRGSVECKIIALSDFKVPDEKCEIRFHSVASLRLDNVLSAGFNVARPLCVEAIDKGLVFVNSVRATKSDMSVKENDKIVLRGKGKIALYEIIGKNKKGRVHINIKCYK